MRGRYFMNKFILILLFLTPFSTSASLPNDGKDAAHEVLVELNNTDKYFSNCLDAKSEPLTERNDATQPAEPRANCGNVFLSVSAFSEEDGDRAGFEISILINTSKNYANRISGVLYSGRNEEELIEAFTGFSFTGYLHLNQKYINPYLGLGVFAGDTFNCSDDEETDECEEEAILTIYPEVGLAINVGKLHIFPYVRRYNFNSHNTYGLNLGLKF